MWCVWVKQPAPTGKASQDGWSLMIENLTEDVAKWLAPMFLFPATAMVAGVRPTPLPSPPPSSVEDSGEWQHDEGMIGR